MKKHLASFLLLVGFLVSLPAEELPETEFSATPLMRQEASLMIQMFEHKHLNNITLGDLSRDDILDNYLRALDHQKMFLTIDDVKLVNQAVGDHLIRDLRRGDLVQAYRIYELYAERARDRFDWVQNRLSGEWDVERDGTFVPDRRELPWPAYQSEADDLWERRLTYELVQELLNDRSMEEAVESLTRRYERLTRNLEENDAYDIQEVFLTSLARLYDPHSGFLSATSFEDFRINVQLSLVGIGAMLSSEDGYCVIRELIPGGPAALSGELNVEDRIVAVAQEGEDPVDVVDMRLRNVVSMIRGEQDTTVILTIIPAEATDSSIRREVSLVRDTIRLTARRASASLYELPGAKEGETLTLGVVEIPSFYGANDSNGESVSVTEDVRKLVKILGEEGAAGILLDFRRNSGGLLSEAVAMTGMFTGPGPVVSIHPPERRMVTQGDYRGSMEYDGPLAVLVSRFSASASEIVAGALQRYGRAVIVGESSTHGKGSVQEMAAFGPFFENTVFGGQPSGAAKLTVRRFYLPDGQSTQNKGVVPDIHIPSFNDHLPIGEGALPRALPWNERPNPNWSMILERKSFPHPVNSSILSDLRENSEARRNSLREFTVWDEAINWFRERQEVKEFPLNIEVRRARLAADEERQESLQEQQRKFARYQFPSREIKLESQSEKEEASATTTLEPPTALNPLAEDEDEDTPTYDLHLNEALRILSDFIRRDREGTLPEPLVWSEFSTK